MEDIAALIPGGVLILNADHEIVYLNAFGYQLLTHEPGSLIGKRVDVLLTTASRIYFQTHLYPLIALGQLANELYLTFQTQLGGRVPVLLNASHQQQPTGQVFICFCFMPVYQRRQYEQELLTAKKAAEAALLQNHELTTLKQKLEHKQAEGDRQMLILQQQKDELEQFGKIIAHDLQEPLRKITLLASTLDHEKADNLSPILTRGLIGIGKASNRLRQLINDLQVYFTPASTKVNLELVDLTELIGGIVNVYTVPDVYFTLMNLPTVAGCREELISLFRHLLDNAVKFRQPNSKTLIQISGSIVSQNSYRATPEKYNYIDYARITVSDNGIGFNNQYREEIFRILKKLDPHSPGLGLGLSLAKKIVERHHGLITAESVESQGTQITLLLPIAHHR